MDFASPQLRSTSAAVHLFGASILAYCFAARSQSGHVSLKSWRNVPWARWCIMLVFLDSWLFHVYAGLLIQGFGTSRNTVTCNMAIYLCIIIYCLSKILIYSFLIERVYVVWPHTGTRLSSKAYCLCLLMMLGYLVVAVLMIVGRNAFLKADHTCMIGLKPFASIPLLSYDLFLNVSLTSMFLFPLQQAHFRDTRLRKIARRTLFAALVALTTSSINIAVLTIKHGEEMGWICLTSCGLDVTVNAVVLYWVTGYRPDDQAHDYYMTTINFSIPFSTHSAAIASSRPPVPTPDLVIPASAQDKNKSHRHASAMTSQAAIASCEERNPSHERIEGDPVTISVPGPGSRSGQQHDSFSMRDRATDYPVAHTETVESVMYARRNEVSRRAAWWPSWPWRPWRGAPWRTGGEGGNVDHESGLPARTPFQVQVSTEQNVLTYSLGNRKEGLEGIQSELKPDH